MDIIEGIFIGVLAGVIVTVLIGAYHWLKKHRATKKFKAHVHSAKTKLEKDRNSGVHISSRDRYFNRFLNELEPLSQDLPRKKRVEVVGIIANAREQRVEALSNIGTFSLMSHNEQTVFNYTFNELEQLDWITFEKKEKLFKRIKTKFQNERTKKSGEPSD